MDKIVNPVIGEEVTFLTSSKQSSGEKTLMEIYLSPTGGNPLHYHKTFTEIFTAIDGELGVKLGKSLRKILNPGESYTVGPNLIHGFFNPTDREIKFKSDINTGHQGFENSLRILYGLAEDGQTNDKGIPKTAIWL